MQFDFDSIAVPFRMQPGLRRLAQDAPQLTALTPGSALHAEKFAVLRAGASQHAVAGFDTGPALAAIRDRLPLDADRSGPIEIAVEQDLAVLDGSTGTIPWLCVCVPSHWAPEDKVGLDFASLHGPVADNAAMLAASKSLVQLVTAGDCWERFVWTISPSARFDQHPRRHAREPWPATDDPEHFAACCFMRTERQSFFRVGRGTRQAVFAIRVMVDPLHCAISDAAKARRVHDALASMSPAVLAYKGLAPARKPLLRWLAARAA